VLCCAVLCCAVLCCAVLCCAVLPPSSHFTCTANLGALSAGGRLLLSQLADGTMDTTAATRQLMAPGGPIEQLLPLVSE
jgi:hypothetical protein